MGYKRILTIQDISCVGQCSLTVALPVLSAAGHETAILPSAVLSTHTGGFKGYTFRDLTEDIPAIEQHWIKEGIQFDGIYTGYLGSAKQIDYVKSIIHSCLKEGALAFIDPAMADNGKLYPGFDDAFVDEMRKLTFEGDVILPNITEACLISGITYREIYDRELIEELLTALTQGNVKTVVLTGVSFRPETTGIMIRENGVTQYYEHEKLSRSSHGTGDVFSSSYVGAYLNGLTALESAKVAADYTVQCIKDTVDDPDHWYGVKFEIAMPEYSKACRK